jgi:hypothetical protein
MHVLIRDQSSDPRHQHHRRRSRPPNPHICRRDTHPHRPAPPLTTAVRASMTRQPRETAGETAGETAEDLVRTPPGAHFRRSFAFQTLGRSLKASVCSRRTLITGYTRDDLERVSPGRPKVLGTARLSAADRPMTTEECPGPRGHQ